MENERENLEQELEFLKESFESEVITQEEYDKAKERIERRLKGLEEADNKNKSAENVEVKSASKDEIVDKDASKDEIKIEADVLESPVIINIKPKKIEEKEVKPIAQEPIKENEVKVGERETKTNIRQWALFLIILFGVFGTLYYFFDSGFTAKEKNTQISANIQNIQIPAIPAIRSKVLVMNSDICFNCDTSRVIGIIKSWFPGIQVEEISYESNSFIADELGLRLLPAYIFDSNVTKYPRFEELKQVFKKVNDKYVLNDDASGGKLYFARENIPNQLTLFFIENEANSQKALDNVKELIGKSNGKIKFESISLEDDLAKLLNIKSAPTFLLNNHIKLSGVHSANTIKENFCRLNSLEVCNLSLDSSLR